MFDPINCIEDICGDSIGNRATLRPVCGICGAVAVGRENFFAPSGAGVFFSSVPLGTLRKAVFADFAKGVDLVFSSRGGLNRNTSK